MTPGSLEMNLYVLCFDSLVFLVSLYFSCSCYSNMHIVGSLMIWIYYTWCTAFYFVLFPFYKVLGNITPNFFIFSIICTETINFPSYFIACSILNFPYTHCFFWNFFWIRFFFDIGKYHCLYSHDTVAMSFATTSNQL